MAPRKRATSRTPWNTCFSVKAMRRRPNGMRTTEKKAPRRRALRIALTVSRES
jgi:hypothetical protein